LSGVDQSGGRPAARRQRSMSSLESERPVLAIAEPDKSLKPHGFQFNFIYNVALFKSVLREFFNLIEMPDFAFISPKADLNFPKV
jgi:hypothetical protein